MTTELQQEGRASPQLGLWSWTTQMLGCPVMSMNDHESTTSIDFEVMNRFHEWAYSHMSSVEYKTILIIVAGAPSTVWGQLHSLCSKLIT